VPVIVSAFGRSALPLKSGSLHDYVLLVILSAIWGASFLFIKIAIVEVTPVTMAAVRIVIALGLLYVIARMKGHSLKRPSGREGWIMWGHFLFIGMLGNGLPFTLVSWGEIEITASLAAILIGVMPVFTVVFAHAFQVEKLTGPRAGVGIGAGFAGLILLIGPTVLGELGDAALHQLALIGAAASYAATAVYARRLTLRMPVLTLATGSMAASAMVMVPAALILESPWALRPGLAAIGSVAFLGVFATGLASIIYFRLLASAGPTFASTINYMIPVFGTGLGMLFLGETVGVWEIAALAMILSGITLVKSPVSR
jgi:drug/metabolite transporter (DMT)-like permease